MHELVEVYKLLFLLSIVPGTTISVRLLRHQPVSAHHGQGGLQVALASSCMPVLLSAMAVRAAGPRNHLQMNRLVSQPRAGQHYGAEQNSGPSSS